MPMSRTKIVCTIGPASDSVETLRAMIRAGMNVARINFSHGDRAAHLKRIAAVREAAQAEGAIIALLGDLQGPKLRVGAIEGGSLTLRAGDEIVLTTREAPGRAGEGHLPHPHLRGEGQGGEARLLD